MSNNPEQIAWNPSSDSQKEDEQQFNLKQDSQKLKYFKGIDQSGKIIDPNISLSIISIKQMLGLSNSSIGSRSSLHDSFRNILQRIQDQKFPHFKEQIHNFIQKMIVCFTKVTPSNINALVTQFDSIIEKFRIKTINAQLQQMQNLYEQKTKDFKETIQKMFKNIAIVNPNISQMKELFSFKKWKEAFRLISADFKTLKPLWKAFKHQMLNWSEQSPLKNVQIKQNETITNMLQLLTLSKSFKNSSSHQKQQKQKQKHKQELYSRIKQKQQKLSMTNYLDLKFDLIQMAQLQLIDNFLSIDAKHCRITFKKAEQTASYVLNNKIDVIPDAFANLNPKQIQKINQALQIKSQNQKKWRSLFHIKSYPSYAQYLSQEQKNELNFKQLNKLQNIYLDLKDTRDIVQMRRQQQKGSVLWWMSTEIIIQKQLSNIKSNFDQLNHQKNQSLEQCFAQLNNNLQQKLIYESFESYFQIMDLFKSVPSLNITEFFETNYETTQDICDYILKYFPKKCYSENVLKYIFIVDATRRVFDKQNNLTSIENTQLKKLIWALDLSSIEKLDYLSPRNIRNIKQSIANSNLFLQFANKYLQRKKQDTFKYQNIDKLLSLSEKSNKTIEIVVESLKTNENFAVFDINYSTKLSEVLQTIKYKSQSQGAVLFINNQQLTEKSWYYLKLVSRIPYNIDQQNRSIVKDNKNIASIYLELRLKITIIYSLSPGNRIDYYLKYSPGLFQQFIRLNPQIQHLIQFTSCEIEYYQKPKERLNDIQLDKKEGKFYEFKRFRQVKSLRFTSETKGISIEQLEQNRFMKWLKKQDLNMVMVKDDA